MIQFIRALRAGAIVSDPTNLKKRQQMIDALMVLLGLAVSLAAKAGYALEFSAEELAEIAGGVFVVYGAVNGMLSAASTDKIGLLPARQPDRVDGPPDSTGGPV